MTKRCEREEWDSGPLRSGCPGVSCSSATTTAGQRPAQPLKLQSDTASNVRLRGLAAQGIKWG